MSDAGLNIPPADVDRSKDMVAALNSLPAVPTAGPLASAVPAGTTWVTWGEYAKAQGLPPDPIQVSSEGPGVTFTFDPTEALAGPAMETRFHLRQVMDYLELPGTQAALGQVAKLSGRPYCIFNSAVNPTVRMSSNPARLCGQLLAARAHHRLIYEHKYEAAADDIETLWRLALGVEDDGTLMPCLAGTSLRLWASREVISWCREGVLTADEARDALGRLGRYRLDRRKAVDLAYAGECRSALTCLDVVYPPGDHSRQVLHAHTHGAGDWLVGSLNLLSPLLYERGEARRWMESVWTVNRLEYEGSVAPEKSSQLREHIAQDPLFAYAGLAVYWDSGRLGSFTKRTEAEEEGVRTALALAVFKAERGRYPGRLEELVPSYLPALGVDPFSGKPLCYRVEPDGKFTLYSVDMDGKDDGGAMVPPQQDRILTWERRPRNEWVLVPVESVSRPASAPSEPDSDGRRMRGPFGRPLR